MSEVFTYEELAGKIDWEGGVAATISYGIKVDAVPEALRGKWATATKLEHELSDLCDEIEDLIGEALGE